jgi:hypothetical protein
VSVRATTEVQGVGHRTGHGGCAAAPAYPGTRGGGQDTAAAATDPDDFFRS